MKALSAERQGMSKGDFECVVTDDSLNPEAKEMIETRFPWVRWTKGPGRGPASNRNHGASVTCGVWLAFTDDDCLPWEDWLKQIKLAMNRLPDIEVIEGKTIADREQQTLAETAPLNHAGGNFWSCNLIVKKSCFESLNGFDEAFPFASMEDNDFGCRMKDSGAKWAFVPEVVVVHPWRCKRPIKDARRFRYSVKIFLEKHPKFRRGFTFWQVLKIQSCLIIKHTLPATWAFKGRGLPTALLEHLLALWFGVTQVFERPGNT